MSLKIITEKLNPLFSRREVRVAFDATKIPTKEEAAKLVAEKFSTKPELVRIKEIQGKFGTQIIIIDSDIYDNEKEFEFYVKKTKKEIEAEKKVEGDIRKTESEAKKTNEEATKVAKAEQKEAKTESEKVEEDANASKAEPAAEESA